LLNNFSRSDTLTVIARVFLLFQMMTVFPLLAYILRTQILYAFFNSIYPSFNHVFSLNVILLSVCVVFAIFLPQVGTITR
jgi:sodium-coupled neutral amino acid transporter 9